MNEIPTIDLVGLYKSLKKLEAIRMETGGEIYDRAEALIEKTRGNSYTEYQIVGEMSEVLQAIKTIFTEYDPQAYGTNVTKMWQVGDKYQAKVWRSNNAD